MGRWDIWSRSEHVSFLPLPPPFCSSLLSLFLIAVNIQNCVDTQTLDPICDTSGYQYSSLCDFARTQASFAYRGYCQVSHYAPLCNCWRHRRYLCPCRRSVSHLVRCVALTAKPTHPTAMLRAIMLLSTTTDPALQSRD